MKENLQMGSYLPTNDAFLKIILPFNPLKMLLSLNARFFFLTIMISFKKYQFCYIYQILMSCMTNLLKNIL